MLASADATGPMGAPAYDVVLLPTHGQVVEYRKRAAQAAARAFGGGEEASGRGSAAGRSPASGCGSVSRAGDPLFGTTVTTFDAWLADLWELYGDGRSLVTPVERAMAMTVAFEEAREELPASARAAGRAEEVSASAPAASSADGLTGDFPASAAAAREGGLSAVHGFVGFAEGAEPRTWRRAARGRPPACASSTGPCAAVPGQEALAAFAPGTLESAEEAAFLRRHGGATSTCWTAWDSWSRARRWRLLAAGACAADREPFACSLEGFPPPGLQQRRRFFAACPWLRLTWRETPGSGRGGRRGPSGGGATCASPFPSGRYARPRLLVGPGGRTARTAGWTAYGAGVQGRAGDVCGRRCGARARGRGRAPCGHARTVSATRTSGACAVSPCTGWRPTGRPCREDLADVLFSPICGRARHAGAPHRRARCAPTVWRTSARGMRGAARRERDVLVPGGPGVRSRGGGGRRRAGGRHPRAARRVGGVPARAAGRARGLRARSSAGRLTAHGAGRGRLHGRARGRRRWTSRARGLRARARRVGVAGMPEGVLVCDLAFAPPRCLARSCDALVLCDMTNAMPARWPTARTRATALLGKLGIRFRPTTRCAQARRDVRTRSKGFRHGAAGDRAVPLRRRSRTHVSRHGRRGAGGLLSGRPRRQPTTSTTPTLLPPALRARHAGTRRGTPVREPCRVARGEPPWIATQVERPAPSGRFGPSGGPLVVLPRRGKDGQAARPCLSASQIESYLACPVPLVRAAPPARASRWTRSSAPCRWATSRIARSSRLLPRRFPENAPALRKVTPESLFAGEGSHVRRARRAGSRPAGAAQALGQPAGSPHASWRRARWTLSRRTWCAIWTSRRSCCRAFVPLFREYEVGDAGERRVRGRAAGRHASTASTSTARGGRWSSTTKARSRRTTSLPAMPRRRRARVSRQSGGAAADAAAAGAPCVPAKVQTLVYAQVVQAACWGSTWWAPCT